MTKELEVINQNSIVIGAGLCAQLMYFGFILWYLDSRSFVKVISNIISALGIFGLMCCWNQLNKVIKKNEN